jgi:hypothetical protein
MQSTPLVGPVADLGSGRFYAHPSMTHSKAIGFAVATLFAALWAFPLARAISFFRWAQAYFADGQSINASNDLRFSTTLLASYSISLLAALGLAWLISRRPGLAFLLPVGFLIFAAVEVLWIRPESPIHLFPTIRPWRPAFISISAVAIAAVFTYFPPRYPNKRNAS